MNRDALFGDPLGNDRVDHRASANRTQSPAPIQPFGVPHVGLRDFCRQAVRGWRVKSGPEASNGRSRRKPVIPHRWREVNTRSLRSSRLSIALTDRGVTTLTVLIQHAMNDTHALSDNHQPDIRTHSLFRLRHAGLHKVFEPRARQAFLLALLAACHSLSSLRPLSGDAVEN